MGALWLPGEKGTDAGVCADVGAVGCGLWVVDYGSVGRGWVMDWTVVGMVGFGWEF